MKRFITEESWVLILVAIVAAFVFPQIGKPFSAYVIYLLMALMFFSLLRVDMQKVIGQLANWKKHLGIYAIIHLLSPAIVLFLKPFFSDELFLGLILAGVMSSGLAVVFLSKLYGGTPSEALVITTFSNILSPIVVPLLVLLFARVDIAIDPLAMSWTMVKLIIIPLVLAAIVRRTPLNNPLDAYSSQLSAILLMVIICGIISPVRDDIIANPNQSFILGLVIFGLVGVNFIVGFMFGGNHSERITYGITASYKNYTLATVVALTLFTPLVALPAILYTLVNNLSLVPLGILKKKR
ncbi:MAG: bile acid:sodium symporter [Patescibacteria group bacterium]|jgi:BASS family bile acid:Na+ symporter